MDDESAMALEQAVQNLDEEDDSSGNEELAHDVRMRPPLGGYPHNGSVEQDARPSNFSRGMPFTFGKVFEVDSAFLQFRRFLEDHCLTRNLNFWLACKNYSEQPMGPTTTQQLVQIAKAIYAKFIKNSAPQHVAISEKTKKQIKMTLELSKSTVTPHLFDVAQAEIWSLMEKNELRQFLGSDAFAECSVFMNDAPAAALYTPPPAYRGCGGGSLQHSSSEDSASITSFSTDSEAGPSRSAFGGLLTRPFPSSMRNAISDTEGSKRLHPLTGPHMAKDKPISHEGFVALLRDRLDAVIKDREAMKRRAQDQARQQGKSYEEIMAIEWFELPETAKYTPTAEGEGGIARPFAADTPSIASACRSPTDTSVGGGGGGGGLPESVSFVKSCAQREVEDALKDLEITKQVSRRHAYGNRSGASSVLSGTAYQTSTDSGVGESWGSIGSNRTAMTASSERLQAYIKKQSQLSQTMPEREVQAQAAAIALISNSPHPESLNPHVAHQPPDSRNRGLYRPRVYNSQSTDDSSSCVTMTSMSSQSELFIPRTRRVPDSYSDQDDQSSLHHISRPHRRQMMPQTRRPPHPHPSSSRPSTAQLVESPISLHPPPGPASHHTPSPSPHNPPTSTEGVLIVYHLGELPTPYAKRVSSSQITLGEFKEKIFAKNPGEYRYFFQTYCPDIGDEVLEEYTDNSQLLPLSKGKVMGRVEKIM